MIFSFTLNFSFEVYTTAISCRYNKIVFAHGWNGCIPFQHVQVPFFVIHGKFAELDIKSGRKLKLLLYIVKKGS